MYLSLYRKWRPRVFDEISGQEHITSILKKQCASNRVSHAYLFCGTRGTGKTSSAKILAKAVNCENPINGNPCNECSSCKSIDSGIATDVLEIDAASNNRVDNVRDLRDEVVYPPSVLKKRVYIIDEVHMLTDSAFNALLKTLEEPPEYVVFILATTEINELPPTIISRCIRFDFSRIDAEAVRKRIEYVAQQENILLDEGASELLSQLADGSMRDALSLLEACSNGADCALTKDMIRNSLGLAGDETIYALLRAIAQKNVPNAIDIISEVHRSSKDISVFLDDLIIAVRDIIIEKQLLKFGKIGKMKSEFASVSEELTLEQLFYISSVLEETQGRISRYAMNKRIVLEMSVIKMCDKTVSDSTKSLVARISELERKLSVLSATGALPNVSSATVKEKASPLKEDNLSVETIPKTTASKPERSPFPNISDVYEFLSTNPLLLPFVQQASIFVQGDDVIVSTEDFAIQMLESDGGQALNDALVSVLGRKVNVIYEKNTKQDVNSNQMSFLDEL